MHNLVPHLKLQSLLLISAPSARPNISPSTAPGALHVVVHRMVLGRGEQYNDLLLVLLHNRVLEHRDLVLGHSAHVKQVSQVNAE
ncbi:hypothetical protein NEOLEDRAFT_955737 [Neolentinus lepideus HHB14362 ss-1]|uniref:Uncharacterized protein n=1 Tax=Neolentinus lepideus HHB14362 ss-1 TaxID=1314782 RepID=A0A165UF78_9AGAM|nr:hypothetical protein NEOLEDRAFT_955737 [Neolentinus lepideus HHB14362 ss-1]